MTISCVEPVTYGQRFLNFLLSVMRGGNISLRPSGLEPHMSKADEKPVGGTAEDGSGTGGQGVDGPTERAVVGHVKAE